MNKILRDNLLRFAILVPVQILILNYVHLFGFLNPYLYLMALLLLPFNMPKSLQYVIAFATGLIIDICIDTEFVEEFFSLFNAFSNLVQCFD